MIPRTKLPNLILLDVKLPGIDGHEVLKATKGSQRLKRIPVVILTSSSDREDLMRAYENGVNSYLVKPPESISYHELVKNLGFYWLGFNHSTPPV